MDACTYWPFAGTSANNAEQIAAQALDYLDHAIDTGMCMSTILADAYQSPPTTASVVARGTFVRELVRRAALQTKISSKAVQMSH